MKKTFGIHYNFPIQDRFPRPDWVRIFNWIDENIESKARHQMHDEIVGQWLDEVCDVLPIGYNIYQTEDLILLSKYEKHDAILLIQFTEKVKSRIQEITLCEGRNRGYGSTVILHFDTYDEYIEYTFSFYPEGEFTPTGGMCLRDDLVHIAMPSSSYIYTEKILAHELLHEQVSDLYIPIWIEEGLAQMIEDEYFPEYEDHNLGDQMQCLDYLKFPDEHIHSFWNGRGFQSSSESSESCYFLSYLLMKKICTQYKDAKSFILNATHNDCGKYAAQKHLGISLQELVSSFLGNGNWDPIIEKDDLGPPL